MLYITVSFNFLHNVLGIYYYLTDKDTEAHHFRIFPDKITSTLSMFLNERMNEGAFSNEESNLRAQN